MHLTLRAVVMKPHKNKKGRPKKPETLEYERRLKMLSNCPKMAGPDPIQESFDSAEKARLELISGHSPTIPHELIYAIESVGDRELFEEDDWVLACEQKTIKKYSTLVEAEKLGQQIGGQVTAEKAMARAKAVWGKNQDLIDKISRNLTLHSAAEKIQDEWGTRGDGGKKPSVNTIKNWYQKII
jgi:hypothetical protein